MAARKKITNMHPKVIICHFPCRDPSKIRIWKEVKQEDGGVLVIDSKGCTRRLHMGAIVAMDLREDSIWSVDWEKCVQELIVCCWRKI
jgi:hypothetical protein